MSETVGERSIAAVSAALVAFQAEMPEITKGKTAQFTTKKGGSVKYSYAALDDIFKAIRPVLAKHGLAVFHITDERGVMCQLVHMNGEFLRTGFVKIPSDSDPKTVGIAITYARRYTLCALLGIAAEEDTDTPPPPAKKVLSSKAYVSAQKRIQSGETGLYAQIANMFELTAEQDQVLANLVLEHQTPEA